MLRASSIAAFLVLPAVLASSTSARADETIEVTPYAAWRRPLTPLTFPGHPAVRRNVVGGAVEWTDAPPPNRTGWVMRFGGAVEHQADCPTSASCPWPSGGGARVVDQTESSTTLPDNHVEWGALARFGWLWRSVQLEGGLLVYTASLSGTPPPPREVTILPDVVARLGTRSAFVALGFGTFTGASILTPMTYLQGELAFADRWASTLTLAGHNHPLAARDVDAYQHLRFDVAMRYRMSRALRAGIGFALTTNDPDAARRRLGGELRFMLEWTRIE